MPAKQTSLTISEAAYKVVQTRKHPGESTSACINRLVLELQLTSDILDKTAGGWIVADLMTRLDSLERRQL